MKRNEWILVALAILLLIISACSNLHQTTVQDDLIRLHVIANSDSAEDQALKYRVRDQLLLVFGETFRDAKTTEEARSMIQTNLEGLKDIASREIDKQGYDYSVEAQLGVYPFPTKVYGELVYPAGDYEALRVVIGEGSGANWWCVMFPPLCFVDVSSGVTKSSDEGTLDGTKEVNLPAYEQKTVVYTSKAAQWWKSFQKWVTALFS